jgi:hypothetical protein
VERFFHLLESDDPPAKVLVAALEAIVDPLERYGYDLVEQSSTQLRFARTWRPAHVWVLALLLLPLAGLVLLVVLQRTSAITIELAPRDDGGTTIIAAGTARANVRRAFAELSL